MRQGKTGVVIGGSIMGLLAARVLSQYFDEVHLIERDAYPDEPAMRHGTPQARHGHILLGAGQKALDRFFPELKDDMKAAGIARFEWGRQTPMFTPAGWMKSVNTGIKTYGCSRIWLEWAIRRRLAAVPNVHLMTETRCTGLLTSADKTIVTGVQVQHKHTPAAQQIAADLVIDASGRESKTPEWLVEMGYPGLTQTVVNAYMGYASRWYQEPEDFDEDWQTMSIFPRPNEGINRGGAILRVENKQWIIILSGANREYPPTDEAGFVAFAKSIATPKLYEWLCRATPISPVYGYRNTENRLNHYEKLKHRPENLLVMGDAACTFNPVYGQGMSVAGVEAMLLDDMLQQQRLAPGFAARFQKKLSSTINNAWLMATGADLSYPETEGQRPGLVGRAAQKYIDQLQHMMTYDEQIATTFLRVMNMLDEPTALFNPRYMVKTLRRSLTRSE